MSGGLFVFDSIGTFSIAYETGSPRISWREGYCDGLGNTPELSWDGGSRYMEQVGSDTVIHYFDHTITLQNVHMTELNTEDFLFA